MDTAFVLYDELTALDLVGPYETLAAHASVRAHFVADRVGPVRADNGLTLHADTAFDELPRPDLIVVPGSSRWRDALANTALVSWLRSASPTATWTTSVCTGSLLLAEAGLLTGRPATTHWGVHDVLAAYGVEVRDERVVRDGRLITAAGVSAGIDMGLTLAASLWGEEVARVVQLMLEYDPQPPFDSGSPARATPETLAAAVALMG
ncbi:DJ-1/PfpI family protein [Actinophytocola xanthii]|uniref:Glutamine amidotransferase n=1 Tax=Actinophytocola xanthii TaxID=1912961 RepID=A0A1Q8CP47_9PSEU|nr:DJ-1/PfpI family protein [Actinophytocola xanthii]OLF16137.1 glutamine amidotransferase [Actinophytocola xanthii]